MTKRYLKTPEEVIQALKDGKKVRDAYGSICKLVDGIIISKLNDFFEIGKPIRSVNKPYILEEEEKPLKIEVGKFYKTRKGDKVIVVYINDKADAGCWPVLVAVVGKVNCSYSVSKTGSYYSSDRDTAWDIIAPWED